MITRYYVNNTSKLARISTTYNPFCHKYFCLLYYLIN